MTDFIKSSHTHSLRLISRLLITFSFNASKELKKFTKENEIKRRSRRKFQSA